MENTKIKFTYGDEEYTLEFTANSLKQMEDKGFSVANMQNRLLNAPEELFCGAFITHHPTLPRKKRLEIYEALTTQTEDGDKLFDVLCEMVDEALDDIINPSKGNVRWEVTR